MNADDEADAAVPAGEEAKEAEDESTENAKTVAAEAGDDDGDDEQDDEGEEEASDTNRTGILQARRALKPKVHRVSFSILWVAQLLNDENLSLNSSLWSPYQRLQENRPAQEHSVVMSVPLQVAID